MPKLSINKNFGYETVGESLTEPEHADSCDINKMLQRAVRGLEVRTQKTAGYGFDDTTMDALTFRIQKETLESQLHAAARSGTFTEDELNAMPKHIREKFKFKQIEAEMAPKNDDKTTKKGVPRPPKLSKAKENPDTDPGSSENKPEE